MNLQNAISSHIGYSTRPGKYEMTDFDINNCTLQEACDYAAKKIVEQGMPCIRGTDCVYTLPAERSPTGKIMHCAIGWLAPNNKSLSNFEGGIVDILSAYDRKEVYGSLPELLLNQNNTSVFESLQAFHDAFNSNYAADKKASALAALKSLNSYGIDTSGEHWKKWIDINTSCSDTTSTS
jgi:hypothetical protein